jgi:hypothetical protein
MTEKYSSHYDSDRFGVAQLLWRYLYRLYPKISERLASVLIAQKSLIREKIQLDS